MRFLIAGSSGFLGTQLRERLVATGHDVTTLVRRSPGSQEVRWDPYAGPLGPEVVDSHDVVVNLAGSPLVGNPHSTRWARELMNSRITTTTVIAEAIAASSSKPVFLAGNGISYYGDHGADPLTEQADSRGDALLTRVSRAWQQAAAPASDAGARVVVLRTSPVFDRRSMPLKGLRLLFSAGLGGRLGDGSQHMPVMSARDWVDAVIHTAVEDVEGPVNLCSEMTPTNAEFTEALGSLLHRPAVVPAPAVVLRKAGGELGGLVLDSVNAVPEALRTSGYTWHDPDVRAVLAEGLSPSR